MQYQLAATATVKMANNTEQMARLIVLSVTGLVFIGISVGCAHTHVDSFVFGGCYFITIRAIPAVKFFNGLHQRNDITGSKDKVQAKIKDNKMRHESS